MDLLSELFLAVGVFFLGIVVGFIGAVRFLMTVLDRVIPIAGKAKKLITGGGGQGNLIQMAGNAILQKIMGGMSG